MFCVFLLSSRTAEYMGDLGREGRIVFWLSSVEESFGCGFDIGQSRAIDCILTSESYC